VGQGGCGGGGGGGDDDDDDDGSDSQQLGWPLTMGHREVLGVATLTVQDIADTLDELHPPIVTEEEKLRRDRAKAKAATGGGKAEPPPPLPPPGVVWAGAEEEWGEGTPVRPGTTVNLLEYYDAYYHVYLVGSSHVLF
jgi:hypothetical protein